MLLRVLHRTTFVYAGAARDSFNEVRLEPLSDRTQTCRRFGLRIEPAAEVRRYADFYGNAVGYFEVPDGHHRLEIEADSEVETVAADARPPPPEVSAAELAASPEREMVAEFASPTRYVPLEPDLWREAQDALAGGRADVWTDVRRLGAHVHRSFAYRPGATGVGTSALEALRLRAGVCQDFAHVLLGLCRSLGMPARYVSGYFLNPELPPGAAEASHAWIEAFLPGHGWAPYDPTHDRPADERYVKVALGRDYADIRPISGTYRGAATRELQVAVQVRPAPEGAAA